MDLLPDENDLTLSMYEVKKNLNCFGMKYKKIITCLNNCIPYERDMWIS